MYKIECPKCGSTMEFLEEYLNYLESLEPGHKEATEYSIPSLTHEHLRCPNCDHTEKIQIVLDRHIDNYVDEETGKKYLAQSDN